MYLSLWPGNKLHIDLVMLLKATSFGNYETLCTVLGPCCHHYLVNIAISVKCHHDFKY